MSKKKPLPEEERLPHNKLALIIALSLIALTILGFVIVPILIRTPEAKFVKTAVIVDQIGDNTPSPPGEAEIFNSTVTSILESAGFVVTYVQSNYVKVDFFSHLTDYGYGIIILRNHYAMRENASAVDIFTSEVFNDQKSYPYVSVGSYSWDTQPYFAVTPEFIGSLKGSFPKSIVIAMGCWSLKQGYTGMADAFVRKGASAYIGWSDMVGVSIVDNATAETITLLLKGETVAHATENKEDYEFAESVLGFYPVSAANLTIASLVSESSLPAALLGLSSEPALLGFGFITVAVPLKDKEASRKSCRSTFS